MCFCPFGGDNAVCKTKGKALTNSGFLANTLSYNSTSLSLSPSLSHTHRHTTALLLTTTAACASLTSTAHKSDKLKKKRKSKDAADGRREGQSKMQAIVCGLSSLFQPGLVQNTHPQTHTNPTNAESVRDSTSDG